MPNFYSRPRGGLLTPPGSGQQTMYGYRNGVQGPYNQNRKTLYEPVSYVPPPAPIMYQPPPMPYNNMPPVPAPMPHQSFGPIAAPTLPPIHDRNADLGHSHAHPPRQERRQDQHPQPAKKEKVTGGVAQELDYEMDQMTDYVSDMAQSMYALLSSPNICLADIDFARSVMPSSKVSPAFRKFVLGLLSSTRLPSSTILLGLNYLARRMNMLNTPTPRKTTDGQVWRMLTIALLLGSKFLDDNTFQNRSWSEVSGISVAELNTLEKEWLDAIEWNLHVDPLTDSDFQSWLASWASWKESRQQQNAQTLERLAPLAPIDTNVQKQQPRHKQYSPQTAYPVYGSNIADSRQPVYPSQSRYDSWSQSASAHELSPPSAPESGPNTPEWMMLPNSGLPPAEWYGYNAFYNNRRNHQTSAPHVSFAPNQIPPYHTPYTNQYSHQGIWGHPAGCGCGYCSRPHESYFLAPGYGQQTVVG